MTYATAPAGWPTRTGPRELTPEDNDGQGLVDVLTLSSEHQEVLLDAICQPWVYFENRDPVAAVDALWVNWTTVHQTMFFGSTLRLRRHQDTGQYAVTHVISDPTVYKNWKPDRSHAAPISQSGLYFPLTTETTVATDLARSTALEIHARYAVVGDSPVELLARAEKYVPQTGLFNLAAVVRLISTCPMDEAAPVAMMAALGGYQNAVEDTRQMAATVGRVTAEDMLCDVADNLMHPEFAGHKCRVRGGCWDCEYANNVLIDTMVYPMGNDRNNRFADCVYDLDADAVPTAPIEALARNFRTEALASTVMTNQGPNARHGVTLRHLLEVTGTKWKWSADEDQYGSKMTRALLKGWTPESTYVFHARDGIGAPLATVWKKNRGGLYGVTVQARWEQPERGETRREWCQHVLDTFVIRETRTQAVEEFLSLAPEANPALVMQMLTPPGSRGMHPRPRYVS